MKACGQTARIIIPTNPYESRCFSFISIVRCGMRKLNSSCSIDTSIRYGERLSTLKWACKFHKHTQFHEERSLFPWQQVFIKDETGNWMGLLPYCYTLCVFNPLAEISLYKPWTTDLSGITSMSLHSLPSSQRPRGAIICLFLQCGC